MLYLHHKVCDIIDVSLSSLCVYKPHGNQQTFNFTHFMYMIYAQDHNGLQGLKMAQLVFKDSFVI